MTEEVTLEMINENMDSLEENIMGLLESIDGRVYSIEDKLDLILGTLNAHTTAINNILSIVNNLSPSSESSEPMSEVTNEFKSELQAKIDEGLPYSQVKAWIIEKLYVLGIYSEADINIKLFTDVKGNIILEVKTRPYRYMGRLLQFLRDSMGEADKFETSRYSMNLIMWYELTKNQQMEGQTSNSSIINEVTEQWGDNDSIDFGN